MTSCDSINQIGSNGIHLARNYFLRPSSSSRLQPPSGIFHDDGGEVGSGDINRSRLSSPRNNTEHLVEILDEVLDILKEDFDTIQRLGAKSKKSRDVGYQRKQ
ncbi:unnamed protein product [Cylindrotheca closterium]|uniref:Uncharacterized protein n=1 Tax=Cylindrotheca closterium TaxID=2856 RepID=A0AAD2JLJ0_9STRA|nr:unnamed protein product [Cylindrotheca closterium]